MMLTEIAWLIGVCIALAVYSDVLQREDVNIGNRLGFAFILMLFGPILIINMIIVFLLDLMIKDWDD